MLSCYDSDRSLQAGPTAIRPPVRKREGQVNEISLNPMTVVFALESRGTKIRAAVFLLVRIQVKIPLI